VTDGDIDAFDDLTASTRARDAPTLFLRATTHAPDGVVAGTLTTGSDRGRPAVIAISCASALAIALLLFAYARLSRTARADAAEAALAGEYEEVALHAEPAREPGELRAVRLRNGSRA
jgi:hypothetical protein